VTDAEAGTANESPVYARGHAHPAWRVSDVTALFQDGDAWLDARPAALLALEGHAAPVDSAMLEPALDQDWEAAIRESYQPVKIAEGLWILPEWSSPVEPAALNLRVHPGLAFGTGDHPTTRLCLRWLLAHPPHGARVLDYGCGSGVLGICALLCGADRAAGADTDPTAVSASLANATLNGLEERFDAQLVLPSSDDPLPVFGLMLGEATGEFDVVLANILLHPLLDLEARLAAYCRRGGRIALSGLLLSQAPQVVAAYGAHFDELRVTADGQWALVEGTRR
jgi:ribosomal protein L11 methyltransferase